MTEAVLSLLLAIASLTGIDRSTSPVLESLAQVRTVETQTTSVTHRYLSELDNGYWSEWAEVLAIDWSDNPDAVQGWQRSAPHWVLLSDAGYTHIGCAISIVADHWYFACIVGTPTLPDTAMT